MQNHRPDLFMNTINTMDYAVTPAELSDALADLIQGVKDTNKKGTLTLKLTIKPESLAAGQLSITPEIINKIPQLPRDKSLMFMTPENNLQREDPRQRTLGFEAVDGRKSGTSAPQEFNQAQ